MSDNIQVAKRKKLFGVSHPLRKAIICVVFVVLTGGIGLLFILMGMLGDRWITKSKSAR